MKKTAIERACEKVGGQAALARAIGVHSSFPNQWIKGHRPIPAERCPDIERATGGEVRCEDLRPDLCDQWSYLRGTNKIGAKPPRASQKGSGDGSAKN